MLVMTGLIRLNLVIDPVRAKLCSSYCLPLRSLSYSESPSGNLVRQSKTALGSQDTDGMTWNCGTG